MTEHQAVSSEPAHWKILLVDDEFDVHEASRLILSDLTFAGREIELLSADSDAQAREILGLHPDIALVLLDVVMETDRAEQNQSCFFRKTA